MPGEISSTGTGLAAVDGITAHACWGERCLMLDRDGKATALADHDTTVAAQVRAAEAFRTTIRVDSAVTACAGLGGKCVTLPKAADWPSPVDLTASASLKRLTVFFEDHAETWDLLGKTKVATFPAKPALRDSTYVGDIRVLIAYAGRGWVLVDALTGDAVDVVDASWDLTVIDGNTAVMTHEGQVLVVNAVAMTAGRPFTLPGHVAMATAWFDRILVVLDHPAATAQIDPKTGTLYSGPALPICK